MKVLVIGSGPIVIGQAAEFDYAGTQACKSLREEGHEVVLVNSNPATIMTDPEVSDALYIEPLTPEFLERVIARERPDALLPTLGGQTGLNLATQLADLGILEKYGLRVLGTPLSAIKKAEDRESFRSLMREIREPVPESWIVTSESELQGILDVVPYPCIIRPAYTLGGTGGGVANTREELWEIGQKGLMLSLRSQIMVERSLLGWKEVEYEVMRDKAGNCITVCNMENLDPMGVHTGDSIVVAPSQTLSDLEYHMLRTASLKIIQALGIEGGCNVQLAVNPDSFDYYIIEVNPRVSRSSALASKATGYPIARVAAKIAVGKTLDQIENAVTGTTRACFEPALDYCVVKIPRWPFDKFATGDRSLFTQMKATGEVMAIDRSFEAAFMKAIRGLELKQKDLRHPKFQRGTGVPPVRPPSVPLVSPEIKRRQGAYLPHWTREGAIYSVTFRLADAIPQATLREWAEERERLAEIERRGYRPLSPKEEHERKRLDSERLERYLDSGAGSCALRDPRAAQIAADALGHFDGQRYRLHAWCVMPNHVHALVEPQGEHGLAGILHSWKSYTAKEINKALGRSGELWQEEYYDHMVRDERDYERSRAYILANPAQARLGDWAWVGDGEREREDGTARDAPGTHGRDGHATGMADDELREAIRKPTDERLWALAEGLRRGWSVEEVNRISRVDPWFLRRIQCLVDMEQRLVRAREEVGTSESLKGLVAQAFLLGYPSRTIADLLQVPVALASDVARGLRAADVLFSPEESRVFREADTSALEELFSNPAFSAKWKALNVDPTMSSVLGHVRGGQPGQSGFLLEAAVQIERQKVQPVFKMVDTCAGEFDSQTPYYYGTFEQEDDAVRAPK